MGSVPHPDSRVERHNALQLNENVFADMRLLQHDNEDEADDTKMEPLSTNSQNIGMLVQIFSLQRAAASPFVTLAPS